MPDKEIVKIEDVSWEDVVSSFGSDLEQLPEEDVEACSYIISGYSIPEAAKEVGITPKTLRRHIKDSPVMQKVIQHKGKLVQEYLLNEFRRQMRIAIDRSKDYIEKDVRVLTRELNRDQIGLLKDQIKHSRWVIEKFEAMLASNPLEGLSITNPGDGTLNVQFNVNTENKEALDYVVSQMDKEKSEDLDTMPRFDEEGKPPYGEFGDMDINQEGMWVCHICGSEYSPGKSFFSHLSGKHKMSKDRYAEIYDVSLGD